MLRQRFFKVPNARLHCWSFIRRRVAAVVSSNKCTRTAGNLLRYDWINSGRKPDTDAMTQPMASDPVSPRAARRAIYLESSAWARISFTSDKKALPAAVSFTLRLVRCSSETPSSSSKDLICWLMAGCATCNSSAARVKFCRSATVTKYLRQRSSRPERVIALTYHCEKQVLFPQ